MRKIILAVATSLDGLIEGPNGEFDWCFTDQDYGMKDFLSSVDAILYGRKSYELMIRMEEGNPFASLSGYVFSNTLQEVKPGYELVRGNAVSWMKEQKATDGKDIWLFGGAELTTTVVNAGLLDELWVSVHPIVLGEGKPLFSGLDARLPLRLMETKPYATGLVSLRYAVEKS